MVGDLVQIEKCSYGGGGGGQVNSKTNSISIVYPLWVYKMATAAPAASAALSAALPVLPASQAEEEV